MAEGHPSAVVVTAAAAEGHPSAAAAIALVLARLVRLDLEQALDFVGLVHLDQASQIQILVEGCQHQSRTHSKLLRSGVAPRVLLPILPA